MYHQVSTQVHPSFHKYTVTARTFAAQMSWLARAGYRAVTLGAVLSARRAGAAVPRRSVVITFDDGFRDCWEHAVPVLHGHGFNATFFLVAGLVGGCSTWLLEEVGIELALMNWPMVNELAAAGFECGAHSMTHPRLTGLTISECRRELEEPRRLLEERLGCPIVHFAYPFGHYDQRVQAMVAEAGYHSACSVRSGMSGPDDDIFALHRVPILGGDSLGDFICRLHTAQSLSGLARRVVRRLERTLRWGSPGLPRRG
jgi:peptidoglycan/xylan/chitin deacetylase (PgdA/CDA1 family)